MQDPAASTRLPSLWGACLLRTQLRALERARTLGLSTIGLAGRDGGDMRALCDLCLVVPHADTARIQEAHIFIGHSWCAMVEQALASAP